MPAAPDAIAGCVLDTFDSFSAKRKPRPRPAGSREWVPLAGIVLAKDGELSCVSLGTGMKCLPASKLPQANGNILHDWHAEILAIRAFNRFLIEECSSTLAPHHNPSRFIATRDVHERTEVEHQAFKIQDGVEIHMYCSEAPCGDASMELIMDAQEDATPWASPPPTASPLGASDASAADISGLRGRSHFGLLGAVRLKPSRPDAPPTLSKSCTDKLAIKQCTSLLSSLTSLLIHPSNAYLSSFVIPQSQYVEAACTRAFSSTGRMAPLASSAQNKWFGGYRFRPFLASTTSQEFKHSRRSVVGIEEAVPSNISAVYTPHTQETLIGGVLQGRKQLDPRGASILSRRSMWKAIAQIATIASLPILTKAIERRTYGDVKEVEALDARRAIKEHVRGALKGWIRSKGDDEFEIKGDYEQERHGRS